MKEYTITRTCGNCNQKFDIAVSKIYKGNYGCTFTGTTTFSYIIDCPHCGSKRYIPKTIMDDLVSAIPNNRANWCEDFEHDFYYFDCYTDGLYENSHSKCIKCGAERICHGYNCKWIDDDDIAKDTWATIGMLLLFLIAFVLLMFGCSIGY